MKPPSAFNTHIILLFGLLVPRHAAKAANDWNVPCTEGTCQWDTGDGNTTAYSSMILVGYILLTEQIRDLSIFCSLVPRP